MRRHDARETASLQGKTQCLCLSPTMGTLKNYFKHLWLQKSGKRSISTRTGMPANSYPILVQSFSLRKVLALVLIQLNPARLVGDKQRRRAYHRALDPLHPCRTVRS